MALTTHYGRPLRGPSMLDFTRMLFNSGDGAVIDAAGEKISCNGWVWWPGFATKSIRKVIFRTSTCAVDAGSVVRVSLQDTDTAVGTPTQPDGTQDQYVDIAGSAITSDTTITTDPLTADRSVAWGQGPLSVVFEYQTFTSTNSLNLVCQRRAPPSSEGPHIPNVSLFTASWAVVVAVPNILFEADDGTIGCFFQAPMFTNSANRGYGSGSPDECGLKFRTSFPTTVCGAQVYLGANIDGRDCQLRLYDTDGTTVLASKDYLGEWTHDNNPRVSDIPLALTNLEADTDYYLVLSHAAGASKNLLYFEVQSASHLTPWLGASKACWVERNTVGSGAFSETLTRLPGLTPYFAGFDGPTLGRRVIFG
jgi:hypothetical protein